MNLTIMTKNQLTFSLNVHCRIILNLISHSETLTHFLGFNFHDKVSSNLNYITIQVILSLLILIFNLIQLIKDLGC